MIDRLLHTPDGVRDTLNDECQKKQSLERELHKVLVSFGYRDLETPTFEFFDVFGREVGTTPTQELYKFCLLYTSRCHHCSGSGDVPGAKRDHGCPECFSDPGKSCG